MQHHHILMRELENGVTRNEAEIHRLISILHAAASLKAVFSTFDFVNTSGQKPSTLYVLVLHILVACWILPHYLMHTYILVTATINQV